MYVIPKICPNCNGTKTNSSSSVIKNKTFHYCNECGFAWTYTITSSGSTKWEEYKTSQKHDERAISFLQHIGWGSSWIIPAWVLANYLSC